jgi:predicted PurR-regulated permease PerM
VLAVVTSGSIFGLLGLLLAAPLMVVVVVLVRKLYEERLAAVEESA